MTADEIVASLSNEFPNKNILRNSEQDTSEILCEAEPSSLHPEYSEAIVYIKSSTPHIHTRATETYKVEKGELTLYLVGIAQTIREGQSTVIKPEVIHWAEGDWARVWVRSEPGWIFEDHIIIDRATSAGGVIVKDGKILFVKFPEGKGITFPKGHIEEGETYEQTALREVKEETGCKDLEIVKNLGMVTRPAIETDGTKVIKDIHLFLMKLTSDKNGSADEETEWLTIEEALTRLMPQEAEFLRKVNPELHI